MEELKQYIEVMGLTLENLYSPLDYTAWAFVHGMFTHEPPSHIIRKCRDVVLDTKEVIKEELKKIKK